MPKLMLLALAVSALLFALVAYDQTHWWMEKPDYVFGWLVPFVVAYVVHLRRGEIAGLLNHKDAPEARGRIPLIFQAIAAIALIGSLAMFVSGALYRAAAGPSNGGTLALTLGAIGSGLTLVFLASPAAASTDNFQRAWKLSALFWFPFLVWSISAPLLTAVEHTLSTFLRARITEVVFGFFDLLGYPIEQRGNVLVLPNGQVGVAEACSGIRSLTGCLFAGSFLAATQLGALWRKWLLITASLLLAIGSNLLRSLFLTGWSIAYGPEAIEGTVHDATGFAVLGLTVLGLLALLPLLSRGDRLSGPAPDSAAAA